MGESIYKQLCIRRSTPEFLRISEQSKKNRASNSEFGTSLHCGGSIPATEDRRRLVCFFCNSCN